MKGVAVRADARANRSRVLAAAEEVFAESGTEAATEEIARRAGVGIGTVFRHFPTKRDLVESTLVAHFEQMAAHVRAVEEDEAPGTALVGVVEHLAEHTSAKLAMAGALVVDGGLDGPARDAARTLRDAVGDLLARAQRAGAVRADVGVDDLYFLLRGLAPPPGLVPESEATRRRALRVVVDGLRSRPVPPVP